MSTFDLLADLPLEVDGYTLEGLRANVSSGFERLSTVVHLRGGGLEGVGEDVVYDAEDQVALQEAGPVHAEAVSGRFTLGEFCELVDSLDLFPVEPAARRLPAVSALDLPQRGARPSARSGRADALGAARSGAPAADVRGLAASRRAADARSGTAAPRALPVAPLQARPDELVDSRS